MLVSRRLFFQWDPNPGSSPFFPPSRRPCQPPRTILPSFVNLWPECRCAFPGSGIFRLFIGFFVFAVFPFGVEQNLFFSVTSFGLLWGFLGILGSYLIFQTIWALLSADCRFYWLKIGIPFLCEAFNCRKSLDANQ